jgi:hypothetical protein
MPRERSPKARLIRIDIRPGEEGLLVATSQALPGLLAIATSEDELEKDLPVLIRSMYLARFGEDVSVLLLEEDAASARTRSLAQWAAVPHAGEAHCN